jgi:uncharacterized protein (DUF4213/DUF364 family)
MFIKIRYIYKGILSKKVLEWGYRQDDESKEERRYSTMSDHCNDDILAQGYAKLADEYEQRGLTPGTVAKFALQPGWNGVIGTHGCCGVAMSFRGNNLNYDDAATYFDIDTLREYVGVSLFDLAWDSLRGDAIWQRSIAVAALNALSQPLVADHVLREKGFDMAVDVSRLVTKDDVVAIVGYGGLVREYAGRCRELHVTDMRPAGRFRTTIVGETIEYGPTEVHVHAAEENKEVLPKADVVFITGSTLVNGTFGEVVGYSRNARLCALYGSSAQLLPDVLFENGIDVAMSVAIADPARFERDVMNSPDLEGSLKRHQRKYTVGRSLPGAATGEKKLPSS